MADIDIKAVYSDMLKCAQILEDIGADVKIAYTDMDDFLNKKMVFNGKQIYANWQSEARSVFEEKSKVIIDIFNKVQEECTEAANTLKVVIKEYEQRDSDLAATTLGKDVRTKPLDFTHFGNMDSADWSGIQKPDYSFIANAANIKTRDDVIKTVYIYAAPNAIKPNNEIVTPVAPPLIAPAVYAGPSVKPNNETVTPVESTPIALTVYAGPGVKPNNETVISVAPTTVYAGPSVKPSNNIAGVTESKISPVSRLVYAGPNRTPSNNETVKGTKIPTPTVSALLYAGPNTIPSNNEATKSTLKSEFGLTGSGVRTSNTLDVYAGPRLNQSNAPSDSEFLIKNMGVSTSKDVYAGPR